MPAKFRLDVSVTPDNTREFELWRSGISPLYLVDACDARARTSFGAEMTSYQFADIAVALGTSSAATYKRTTKTIAQSGIDTICLLLYADGGCDLDLEGRSVEVRPGDVCLLDMTRANALRAPGFKSLTVMLPRTLITPFLADPDGLHGQVLPKSAPLNTVLASHLWTLLAQAPALSVPDVRAAGRAIAAMVAAFAGASADGRNSIARAAVVVSLQAARRIVETNLQNPALGPEFLCQQLGVSRAKLYRLFEPLGGASHFIQQRRMRQAYHDIIDPACRHERVGEIAARYGFSSISVFSRAFRQAYGASPSELRDGFWRTGNAEPGLCGDSVFETMNRWLLGTETVRRSVL
ncbi:helix-turn-helix domain-containing protein [Aminobacter anthyllidis]|uniref:Helix-turn-helix domain-containing protein n=1 Tax=Aminobacter anthyllidis TaxID=1035067 RepID=A0A9X1A5X4_9HYPH|nr:helix-turn-helix domain-containing protein [Aminobacter anthyllidis]MBT1153972.1 helix-turn-helix domain-containing protein [Aminobacter anthyllidis]